MKSNVGQNEWKDEKFFYVITLKLTWKKLVQYA